MQWLFAATLALAAFLLFWAELLVGRLLVPRLGGAPAVWATCLLFFQATLLLGYGACRLTARWVGNWRQASLVALLLGGAALVLPFGVPAGWAPDPARSEVAGILLLLLQVLGLPFLAVALLSPLLQSWYGTLGRADSLDPYFLYGASNLGSLLALVGHPLLLESRLGLAVQTQAWAAGFGVLLVSLVPCVLFTLRAGAQPAPEKPEPPLSAAPARRGWTEPLRWVVLSCVPASLLYGVTTALTTDVAPIPLLWAAPLIVYLGSFVVAFARRPLLPFDGLRALLPVVIAALILATLLGNRGPLGVVLILHLLGFGAVACVLHRDLADRRPAEGGRGRLESYFLWIAVGGLLGGVLHLLVAPLLLTTDVDYVWALLVGGLLATAGGRSREQEATPFLGEARAPEEVLTSAPTLVAPEAPGEPAATSPSAADAAFDELDALAAAAAASRTPPPAGLARAARLGHAFAAGVLACVLLAGWSPRLLLANLPAYALVGASLIGLVRWAQVSRPQAAATFALLLLAGQCALGPNADSLHVERSFFGTQRVVLDRQRQLNSLLHGTTVHGRQSHASGQERVPLSYYGNEGPVGQLFAGLDALGQAPDRVAVIGLGVGCLAAYARTDTEWCFYELDPATERIARDPNLFTFLADAPVPISVVLGDARLTLADHRGGRYDLLVLDAFCSDAIPVHLLTREAFDLYLRQLAPGGLLLINISNRYLNLEPVVEAHAVDRGLVARVRHDLNLTAAQQDAGLTASSWVALGAAGSDLAGLTDDLRWGSLIPGRGAIWTDDHADVWGVLRLR